MSRTRLLIAAVFVVAFVLVGAALIYANPSRGGQNRTFNLTVTSGSKMTPDTLTANQNDTLTINVTSDTNGEVHLHGYDLHFETKAGKSVTQTFKADKTGSFDIEWESTSAPLGKLVVS